MRDGWKDEQACRQPLDGRLACSCIDGQHQRQQQQQEQQQQRQLQQQQQQQQQETDPRYLFDVAAACANFLANDIE